MRLAMLSGAIGALALSMTGAAFSEPQAIDYSHSRIGFTASHFGFSTVHGHFRKFDAEIDFDPDEITATKVNVTIDVTTVDSNWPDRDKYLLRPEFFDAKKHPTITFVSSSVAQVDDENAVVTGDLTMRGVTREETFDVSLVRAGPSPFEPDTQVYGFIATGDVDRTQYGVSYAAPGVSAIIPIRIDLEISPRK